eukprot:760747-Hanusia_phi.AAC.4
MAEEAAAATDQASPMFGVPPSYPTRKVPRRARATLHHVLKDTAFYNEVVVLVVLVLVVVGEGGGGGGGGGAGGAGGGGDGATLFPVQQES